MKTETVTITCDNCGADLKSHNTPAEEWRFVISVERIQKTSNYSHSMHYEPPLDAPMHFCNMKCLRAGL